jgi:hypothetical protein
VAWLAWPLAQSDLSGESLRLELVTLRQHVRFVDAPARLVEGTTVDQLAAEHNGAAGRPPLSNARR